MLVMQGKGEVITWWLVGENNPDFPDLAPASSMNQEADKCDFKVY